LNKAEALGVIEPLDGALFAIGHEISSDFTA
jgi:hypothetical protein